MKLAFVITLTVLGYALCEQCTTNLDCTATSCGAGSDIVCQHDEAAGGVTVNGGLCTCADSTTGECVTAADCYGDNAPGLKCDDTSTIAMTTSASATASPECVTASDCYGDNAPGLKCDDTSRHCYDNKCICDRFPIGGKRGTKLI